MKNKIYNTFCLIGVFVVAVVVGNVSREAYMKYVYKEENKLVDTLPLPNDNELKIELIDDVRLITLNYKTLQYLSKSKKYVLDATKKVNQLFLRLEDK